MPPEAMLSTNARYIFPITFIHQLKLQSDSPLTQCAQAGTIKPPVAQSLPMTDLMQAFDIMSQRGVIGKLVLTNPVQ